MSRTLTHILAGAVISAALLASYKIGRIVGQIKPVEPREVRDSIIYRRDTIRLSMPPQIVYRKTTDTMLVAVCDTIRMRDTLWLPLPREEREYGDSTYKAKVSGYDPRLDWVEVYPKETIVMRTREVKPRWSAGISAGVAVTCRDFQPAPFVGVSISRNVLSWGY